MQKLAFVPHALTLSRVVALFPLLSAFFAADVPLCFVWLFFCVATDVLDGYLARKLGTASRVGTYVDVFADFAVVVALFAVLVGEGFYPLWVLMLVVFGFAQFVFSSFWHKTIYDPVGKYFGSVLFGAAAATIVFPLPATVILTIVALPVFSAVSVSTRVAYLLTHTSKV